MTQSVRAIDAPVHAPGLGPPPTAMPMSGWLILAAVAVGVEAQGGFYLPGQALIGVLVAAAAVAAALSEWSVLRRWVDENYRRLFVLTTSSLSGFWLLNGAARGHWTSGVSSACLVLGAAAVVVVCAQLPALARSQLADGVLLAGSLVAVSGFLGVAGHISRLAHVDQGLWRAATSMTYANAAAGLLVPLVLLAIARIDTDALPKTVALRSAGGCTLLLGSAATMSRGGAAALAVGLIVLAAILRVRRVVAAIVGPTLGAVVATGALLPSMREFSRPHVAVGVAGLVAGVAVAAAVSLLPARIRPRISRSGAFRRTVVALFAVVAVGAVIAAAIVLRHSVGSAAGARFSASSSDRVGEAAAAWHQIEAHPWLGSGPGGAPLRWHGSSGDLLLDRFAHDEYLQILWKSGLVGLAVFLAALTCGANLVRRGRHSVGNRELWAGAVAGLAALAVSSSLDFLWHLAVIPLVGAVLAGVAIPRIEEQG